METEVTLNASLQETTQDIVALVRPRCMPSLADVLMVAAALSAFCCVGLLTVPGLIFNHPNQNSYFLFARILETDKASLLPLCLCGLGSASALLLPFDRLGHKPV